MPFKPSKHAALQKSDLVGDLPLVPDLKDQVAGSSSLLPVAKEIDGIMLFNPGSLSYPRQEGRKPSYIVLTVDDEGELGYELKFFDTL